jgi:uncharacterized membrane protein YcaP (DUF421 family)
MNQFLDVNPLELGAIILRTATVYLSVLVLLRLAGKRQVAQLSVVDFVLVLLISNAVQNAMVGESVSVNGGLAAAVTLLVINIGLNRLLLRNERLGAFLAGEPTLLIRNGQVLENHLAREGIRMAELEAALREHGFEDPRLVRQAILECDGSISIVVYGPGCQESQLPPLPRQRHHARHKHHGNGHPHRKPRHH